MAPKPRHAQGALGMAKHRKAGHPGRSSRTKLDTLRKVRYRDKLGAQIALASTMAKGKARREEVRVYRCPDCRGWHLTSRGKR